MRKTKIVSVKLIAILILAAFSISLLPISLTAASAASANDCYIIFGSGGIADSVNLSFHSGESQAGTYGTVGGKGAYTTATVGGETYLYCNVAPGLFNADDRTATIIIDYYSPSGSTGDAFEIYYKEANWTEKWTPRVKFQGNGEWKQETIILNNINFAGVNVNGATFRITCKNPTSIASIQVVNPAVKPEPEPEPDPILGENCFVLFGSQSISASKNLSLWFDGTGTYGTVGGKGAYTSPAGGNEQYIYCTVSAGVFKAADRTATVIVDYFSPSGSSGDAFEIWYKTFNWADRWTPRVKFQGNGQWKQETIILNDIDFVNVNANGATFRITCKNQTSIASIIVVNPAAVKPEPEPDYGDCYISFKAEAPFESAKNLRWEPQDSGRGIYELIGGKGAYSTPNVSGESYLYCYITEGYFKTTDNTATVKISYYDAPGKTGDAIEIWYKKNGGDAWSPKVQYTGSGTWKTAEIKLEGINFVNNKVNNGADFRITAKSPVSISLIQVVKPETPVEPDPAPDPIDGDCYIIFTAKDPYEMTQNLRWEPQDSGRGTYGAVAGKNAYTTPNIAGESYLYCYITEGYFKADDNTATVKISYYDAPGKSGNAIEIWYKKNGGDAWTPMIQYTGSGTWKIAEIKLEGINFVNNKVNNGADFRITAKAPVSISSVKVFKPVPEPEPIDGNCYIRFAATPESVIKNNLDFVSGESPIGTYGVVGGKGAYTTNKTTGGETYLYCQIAPGIFEAADSSATVIIEYYCPAGSSGDAFELYYKNRSGGDTWTSPRAQFTGDGRWKTEYIYLGSINFVSNKIHNNAEFRITAKNPVSIASIRVEKGKVTDPGGNLTALKLDRNSATIAGYGRLKLNYSTEPADATISSVTWSSSNANVAAVGTSGMVLGVSPGTAVITASTVGLNGTFTATCNITVTAVAAQGVEIIPGSLDLKVSEGKMINYWVTPAGATDKVVRWASSDESIATVTVHGYVTAIAPGSAVITATTKDGGFIAECPITVYPLDNAGIVARNAKDFLMSIGVCSHVGQGDNVEKTIEALNYTGIRVVRDDNNTSYLNRFLNIANSTGVKYLMVNSGPNEGSLTALLNTSRTLANNGSLLALEGPNEPNNWAVNYFGLQNSSTANNRANEIGLSLWMRDFYIGAKSDAVLKDYPVFASSEAGGSQYTNIGQQFLTIPEGANTRMPDGTQFADYANVHNYICRLPNIIDNMPWLNASSDNVSWVDGIYQEYGRTWRSPGYDGYKTSLERQHLPKVTTETGWATSGPNTHVSHTAVTQEVQGKLFLNMYLAQYARGFDHTFIYYLLDNVSQDCGFGFYDENGRPKKSADYLHNMTAVLNDDSVIDLLGDVNYSINNQPETVHDLLLQKSDGTFELVIWNEKVSGSNIVTVDLGAAFTSVKIYDPTIGVEPVEVLENADSVVLTLTDHPVILEFAEKVPEEPIECECEKCEICGKCVCDDPECECEKCDCKEEPPELADADFLIARAASIIQYGLTEKQLVLSANNNATLTLIIDGRAFVLAVNVNNRNVSGSIALPDGSGTLIFDIKGNGSNIKEFKIIKK